MIEKILEMLEKEANNVITNIFASEEDDHEGIENNAKADAYERAIQIVQEVAKEYEDKANEARENFMENVYAELYEDTDNNRANRIIEAFDTYAPYQKGV